MKTGHATLPPLTGPGQRHLVHQVAQFSRSLRAAGVEVSPGSVIDLCQCLDFVDLRNRADFHAAARATLVSSHTELPVFEQVFSSFWQGREHAPTPKPRCEPQNEDEESELRETELGQSRGEVNVGPPEEAGERSSDDPAWSAHEVLLTKDLSTLSDQEVDQARRLLAALVELLANTASRRMVASRLRGRLDLRRMLRANAFRAPDGMDLRYRRKRISNTRLLLLCDVSGSMERYSTFLIQFIWALRQHLTRIDVAVFSTRLTSITEHLRWHRIDRALEEVSAHARDWGGGTQIGHCLRSFNDRFADRMRRSRSVAIILSDGWDRGDANLMRDEMRRLHESVQRLVWLNPLLGHDAYQPLCQGMRTALPYIDDFLPAHNLQSLAALLRQLRGWWR